MDEFFKEEMLKNSRAYHIPVIMSADDDDESILLCVRGFGGGRYSSAIEKLARALKPYKTGVVSFTWPGHGVSDVGGEMLTVENCMSDMEEICEMISSRFPEKKLSCFATSFGGYMSILFNQKHPEMFERSILRSPAVKMADTVMSFVNEEQKEALYRGEKLDFGFEENHMLLGIDFYEDLKKNDAYGAGVSEPSKFSIIQGDCDEVVSPDDVRDFAEKEGIKISWVKGADHQYSGQGQAEEMIAITLEMLGQ